MKTLKILAIAGALIVGCLVLAVFVGVSFIGNYGPETSIYLGQQVPKRYLDEIKTLGLLEDGEQIKYFYSDALVDVKKGMYFVTDRRLVLYADEWAEPKSMIEFKDIKTIECIYNESFFEDSMVYLETHSGMEFSFPLSSEYGRDKAFVAYLEEKSGVAEGAVGVESEPSDVIEPGESD